MRTDAALRRLLRTARRAEHLTQEEAATRSGITRGYWKRIENAAELSVGNDTLLDMFQVVKIRPAHLERTGHRDLAKLLSEREAFASDSASAEDLQEYLSRAPTDDETKRALMLTAKIQSEMKDHRADPFTDAFLPPPKAH